MTVVVEEAVVGVEGFGLDMAWGSGWNRLARDVAAVVADEDGVVLPQASVFTNSLWSLVDGDVAEKNGDPVTG